MKKTHFFIIVTVMLLLVACNENTETNKPTPNPTRTEQESTDNEATENNDNTEIDEEEEADVDVVKSAPTDLAGVLAEWAIATRDIKTVSIKAFTTTDSTIMGNSFTEENEGTGKTILEPFTQYLDSKGISGVTDDMEMYFNDEFVYMHLDDTWVKMDNILDDMGIGNAFKEKHVNHFIENIDVFELKDAGDHYLIIFIGLDEKFQEVIHSTAMKPDTLNDLVEGLNETLELTGEIEMKISKDTYLLDEYYYVLHSKNTGLMDLEITDIATSTYTYNSVDPFSIPQNIIDQAEYIGMPSLN